MKTKSGSFLLFFETTKCCFQHLFSQKQKTKMKINRPLSMVLN
ncbi:unnamed protein product, partial [Linum tenue]